MKKETPSRRCSECTRRFKPNPRAGDRQVTCGDAACRRKRHARNCKRWHEEHPQAKANHYEDVVKPYRSKYPSYQRRWRLAVRLREIRDAIRAAVGRSGSALNELLRRGKQAVDASAKEPEQIRAMTGKPLTDALQAAEAVLTAIGTFCTVAEPLVWPEQPVPRRDTRRDRPAGEMLRA